MMDEIRALLEELQWIEDPTITVTGGSVLAWLPNNNHNG
jgi:hypothetical protein